MEALSKDVNVRLISGNRTDAGVITRLFLASRLIHYSAPLGCQPYKILTLLETIEGEELHRYFLHHAGHTSRRDMFLVYLEIEPTLRIMTRSGMAVLPE